MLRGPVPRAARRRTASLYPVDICAGARCRLVRGCVAAAAGGRGRLLAIAGADRDDLGRLGAGDKDIAAMNETRIESDSIGEIAVPAPAYWGAQTQRSLLTFPFGARARMPIETAHALALAKQTPARLTRRHRLPPHNTP